MNPFFLTTRYVKHHLTNGHQQVLGSLVCCSANNVFSADWIPPALAPAPTNDILTLNLERYHFILYRSHVCSGMAVYESQWIVPRGSNYIVTGSAVWISSSWCPVGFMFDPVAFLGCFMMCYIAATLQSENQDDVHLCSCANKIKS